MLLYSSSSSIDCMLADLVHVFRPRPQEVLDRLACSCRICLHLPPRLQQYGEWIGHHAPRTGCRAGIPHAAAGQSNVAAPPDCWHMCTDALLPAAAAPYRPADPEALRGRQCMPQSRVVPYPAQHGQPEWGPPPAGQFNCCENGTSKCSFEVAGANRTSCCRPGKP